MKLLKVLLVSALTAFAGSAAAEKLAISADGNVHDNDDLCATPMGMSIIWAAHRKDDLVHVEFNNHLGKNGGAQAQRHVDNIETMRNHYGYSPSIIFDMRFQQTAGTANLAAEINSTTSSNKLKLHCGGPMQTCWDGLNEIGRAHV